MDEKLIISGNCAKSVPVGLRVYASCSQGGRKYMEDNYDLKYQFGPSNQLQYIYLAIFDGHGGDVAAKYAKECLCENIIRQRGFWSTVDEEVLKAIHKGFVQTHYDMQRQVVNWPKTASGLPSTSGTTASIVFIMNGKYYTGHVGDSRIVLGRKHEASGKWMSCSLTRDHKPESPREKRRIEAAGGQVMKKSGVDRVVWNRPKLGHKGPVRRSTSFDQIPFLAVARSLGDLWSYNSELNTFIVSPEPDVKCIPIDGNDMCLLLASDGLWNMMTTQTAVKVIQEVEEDEFSPELLEAVFGTGSAQLSPSRALVHFCLNRWYQSRFRADNTTVLAVMLEDNQEVELIRDNQNLPTSALFSDSEEEESDDGYDESLDNIEFFGDNYDYIRSNLINNKIDNENNNNLNTKPVDSTTGPSAVVHSTATEAIDTTIESVPEIKDTPITTESTEAPTPVTPEADANNQITNNDIVLTPLLNLSPNIGTIVDNSNEFQTTDSIDPNSSPETTVESTVGQTFEPIDDSQSRDSGTASPPTLSAISAGDVLTEEEYAALPSLVNLSQNEWELFVVIDPKNLSVDSTDLNAVSISGEENSCVVDSQSSLANLNKVIEENTSLNNYIYSKTGYIRHQSQTQPASNPTTGALALNGDNYWSESSNYFSMTSIKPRTSLPLSFSDNHSLSETNCSSLLVSPMMSVVRDRTTSSSAINENNLSIFGALKSCAINKTNNFCNNSKTGDNSLQKLSQILNHNSNSGLNSMEANLGSNGSLTKNRISRHSRLLRRITIDNHSAKARLTVSPRIAAKRKYSPDYSPPSKHLRSNLWTRPLVSKEQIMRMSFTRSLKQLSIGRLTRSRLRPMKLLKAFNNKK